MSKFIYVRPIGDKNNDVFSVPYPYYMRQQGRFLPKSGKKYDSGIKVPFDSYWSRRLKAGEIEIVKDENRAIRTFQHKKPLSAISLKTKDAVLKKRLEQTTDQGPDNGDGENVDDSEKPSNAEKGGES